MSSITLNSNNLDNEWAQTVLRRKKFSDQILLKSGCSFTEREALNVPSLSFSYNYTFKGANNIVSYQISCMRRLVCAFVVHMRQSQVFSIHVWWEVYTKIYQDIIIYSGEGYMYMFVALFPLRHGRHIGVFVGVVVVVVRVVTLFAPDL